MDFFFPVMFPVIRTLDVHGPRLPLKNSKLKNFGGIHYTPKKAFVAKSVQRRLNGSQQGHEKSDRGEAKADE